MNKYLITKGATSAPWFNIVPIMSKPIFNPENTIVHPDVVEATAKAAITGFGNDYVALARLIMLRFEAVIQVKDAYEDTCVILENKDVYLDRVDLWERNVSARLPIISILAQDEKDSSTGAIIDYLKNKENVSRKERIYYFFKTFWKRFLNLFKVIWEVALGNIIGAFFAIVVLFFIASIIALVALRIDEQASKTVCKHERSLELAQEILANPKAYQYGWNNVTKDGNRVVWEYPNGTMSIQSGIVPETCHLHLKHTLAKVGR